MSDARKRLKFAISSGSPNLKKEDNLGKNPFIIGYA
jgi:hypothetical protein